MTALEMLKELQKEWEFQAKDQGIVTNYRLYACADELQPIIDKLREEQKEKHKHTLYTDCCSCGWNCAAGSNLDECKRQHTEHVKEQK